jgi:hypothetical protein
LDLSHLRTLNASLSGSQIAAEATAVLNRKFGDEAYFDFSAAGANNFKISTTRVASTVTTPVPITITPSAPVVPPITDLSRVTVSQAVAAIQAQIDARTTDLNVSSTAKVTVSYDYSTQGFKFTDGTNVISLKSGTNSTGAEVKNEVLNLTPAIVTVNENGYYPGKVIPNGSVIRAASEQRYGMKVTFDSVNKVFKFQSGKTGDSSAISITSSIEGAKPYRFHHSSITLYTVAWFLVMLFLKTVSFFKSLYLLLKSGTGFVFFNFLQ